MKACIARWLDAHANPEWRQLLSFHSTWVAMFWFLFYGAFMSLTAFVGTDWVQEHPFCFMGICMTACMTWGFARLTKQPGTHDVQ